MKKLKLNLDQLKNTEVLTRDQLRKVLGGMAWGSDDPGSGGCTSNVDCAYLGPDYDCIQGVCRYGIPGGSGACTTDTPAIYLCVPNHDGCCIDPLKSCVYGAGGWECSY